MTDIDWSNLGFDYTKADKRFQAIWSDGEWSDGELLDDEYIHAHECSTVFNYGQSCFEGMKAQRNANGDILLFRVADNAQRMQEGARRLSMAEVPTELFTKGILEVVQANTKWVPPYGLGASLYIRPLLYGIDPMVSVTAAPKFAFRVYVTPVGPYYSSGKIEPISLAVTDYDRAAPQGTGNVKAGGNYAAGIVASKQAKADGANEALYLDAATKTNLEEAGACNILIINNDGKLITPHSSSILHSITRRSLLTLAQDKLGMTVEERDIPLAAEIDSFDEVAVCGTAAVLTPVGKILFNGQWHSVADKGSEATFQKLYRLLMDIQTGETDDPYGWVTVLKQS